MHEFSIALSIVDIVTREAMDHHASAVSEVELDIGVASGVVQEALVFALESAVKNTMLASTRFIIHEIPAVAACHACGKAFDSDGLWAVCPHCGEPTFDLVSGRELKVRAIRIE